MVDEPQYRVVTTRTLVGVFEGEESAAAALARLIELGIPPDDATVTRVVQEAPPQADLPVEPVKSGAATGAALGGLLGALAGWMISTGALALPGIGSVEGAGPLSATLAGLGFGAGVGALIGALLSLGIPRHDTALTEAPPQDGPLYMSVTAPVLLIDAVETALIANGALEVQGSAPLRPPTSPPSPVLRAEGEAPAASTLEDTAMADKHHLSDTSDGTADEEGRDPTTVTGTTDAIDPETGALGTGGTPMTTGYGVSGSTIGTGTAQGQAEQEEGVRGRPTPDSGAYDFGGRGSSDSEPHKEGLEHSQPTTEKYGPVAGEDSSGEEKPGGGDLYTRGPSYGNEDRTGLDADQTGTSRPAPYSGSSVDSPPSYANAESSQAQESPGTNIPGTEDPRGLGDNTDDEPRH
jgi:hypothetical protein